MRLMIIALALAGLSAPALSHPEGHDEYSEPVRIPVTDRAQDAVSRLVRQEKLPASWNKAKLVGRELRTKDGTVQWVVIFQNDAERKRKKRMLYVLMTPAGGFISADHKLA